MGDFDMNLIDKSSGRIIGTSHSENNEEEIEKYLSPGQYELVVFGFNGDIGTYSLSLNLQSY